MQTLRYVVLANGLLAVVSIAYYVLLRRETFFETNRLALWLGLTASLVLPLLELPDWRPQPVRTAMHRAGDCSEGVVRSACIAAGRDDYVSQRPDIPHPTTTIG